MSLQSFSSSTTLSDLICVYPNALSSDFCRLIVDEYGKDDSAWQASSVIKDVFKGTIYDESSRNSEVCYMSHMDTINKNKIIREQIDIDVFNCVNKVFLNYQEKIPFYDAVEDEGYSLLRYKEGAKFIEHSDHIRNTGFTSAPDLPIKCPPSRQVSCSVLLNDDFEGGELSFFGDTYTAPVAQGSVVFFPSSRLFPHQVKPVTRGVRYAIVTWFS